MKSRGKFIVFEGLDGSGKSTQVINLKRRIIDTCKKRKCVDEREPDDGVVGLITRGAVKGTISLQPETIALLQAAGRYEHVISRILPQLEKGNHVICDRFYFSNFVYNQTPLLTLEDIMAYNKIIMDKLKPDVTFFLDISVDESVKRRSMERADIELFEKAEYQKIVRENYMKAFEVLKDSENIKVIDAVNSENKITEEIWIYLLRNIFTDDDLV